MLFYKEFGQKVIPLRIFFIKVGFFVREVLFCAGWASCKDGKRESFVNRDVVCKEMFMKKQTRQDEKELFMFSISFLFFLSAVLSSVLFFKPCFECFFKLFFNRRLKYCAEGEVLIC